MAELSAVVMYITGRLPANMGARQLNTASIVRYIFFLMDANNYKSLTVKCRTPF